MRSSPALEATVNFFYTKNKENFGIGELKILVFRPFLSFFDFVEPNQGLWAPSDLQVG